MSLLALITAFLLSSAISYVFWYGDTASDKKTDFSFSIAGELPGEQSPLSRLPYNTPQDIYDRVEEIWDGTNTHIVDLLVDALIPIIEDLIITGMSGLENSAEYRGVMIGTDRNDLFGYPAYSGNFGSNARGHFLVYTENVGGELKYQVVYVNPESGFHLQQNNLDEALSYHWTRINLVSQMYKEGNTYTVWTAPVMTENGREYLLWNGGYNSAHPSVNGAWFEKSRTNTFLPNNSISAYYQGYITEHDGQWFIAKNTAWQAPTPNPNPWDPWEIIPLWSNGTYAAGSVVRTSDHRFFRARTNTSVAPSTQSARSGEWIEINNGWIGIGLGNIIRPHYISHNNYSTDDIVIYGISARHNYRYFRALKPVPPDQKPIMRDSKDVTYINAEYWQPINN